MDVKFNTKTSRLAWGSWVRVEIMFWVALALWDGLMGACEASREDRIIKTTTSNEQQRSRKAQTTNSYQINLLI